MKEDQGGARIRGTGEVVCLKLRGRMDSRRVSAERVEEGLEVFLAIHVEEDTEIGDRDPMYLVREFPQEDAAPGVAPKAQESRVVLSGEEGGISQAISQAGGADLLIRAPELLQEPVD